MTTPDLTPDELREAAQRARESVDSWPSFLFDRAADELERLRAQVASGDDLTVAYMAGAHDARRAAPATDKQSLTVGERERFEADIRARLKLTPAYFSRDPNGYANEIVEASWQGWQARAAQPAAQAEPLSDEQIETARLAELIPFGSERRAFINGIRLAERAHGIGSNPPAHGKEG